MPVNIRPIVRFILSAAACWAATTSLPARAADVRATTANLTSGVVTVRVGSQPVLEYQSAASPYKPYVRQLFTPAGVEILRDSPEDHKHHHGLMFAVKAGGVNFWEETKRSGKQVGEGVPLLKSSVVNGVSRSTLVQQLDWVGPDDRKVLGEQRTISVLGRPDIPATLVTWRSRLHAPKGAEAVTLKGTHYDGLGMRFVESMDAGGRFFNSEGKDAQSVRGTERVGPARWAAYTSMAGDKKVTVALFDHPKNPRPGHLFTMTKPFAYLSITLNVWKEPLDMKPDSDLDLRYGVAIWDGEIKPEQVEKVFGQWKEWEP